LLLFETGNFIIVLRCTSRFKPDLLGYKHSQKQAFILMNEFISSPGRGDRKMSLVTEKVVIPKEEKKNKT
jgi:hypothetical protein